MGSRSVQSRTSHSPYLVGPAAREKASNTASQQLGALQLESAELHRELFEAAQMQRTMSGPRQMRRGEFVIAAEIFPVRHLSGDFVTISDCGSTTLLALGDIAGKGLRAGLWFTHMLGLTRMYAESIADPGEALAQLNRHLCKAQPRPPLTSLFLAKLDWAEGKLTYSNAGHPPPLLMRAENTEYLTAGGPVLAAVPDARFEYETIELRHGDMLIACSDGLLECCNEHREEFGNQRLEDEFRKLMHCRSVGEALFSIIGAAQDFAGTRPRTDDCSVMLIRRDDAIVNLSM